MDTHPQPRGRARRRRSRVAVPPQHGAWAYLAVPLVLGFLLSGWSPLGGLFALTWVLAYPASYYLSRAAVVRLRRGRWSRIARRELRNSLPWLIAVLVGAAVLLVRQPWLLAAGLVLGSLWVFGSFLALRGRERDFGTDLLLVGQAAAALPLLWLVSHGGPGVAEVPRAVWVATAVCVIYFVGSVIHVKSLIRRAGDRRWHVLDVGYHAACLLLVLGSWWFALPFGAAMVRSAALRPGARPALIGAVEAGVCLLVVVGTTLAVGPTV